MSLNITLQKWGNSKGVRIPKSVLDMLNWEENENLELEMKNNKIIIKKDNQNRKTIQELFKDYDGKYTKETIDWGEARGKEVW
ncbi:AbrB/MazE/SpoVT family DNA-binding domain-containing protein [Candidatus Gracilibacteria bacterium]|nr:MAG: AbrB/MazE/SpoVT family DNA-binding domain-containing protein [Candidatus Gracilibacteria bacterium]